MGNIFKKNKKPTYSTMVTPKEGMKVSHIYGEFGFGSATIIEVSLDGKRVIADAHKGANTERYAYIHRVIPAGSNNSKTEYFVREDQQAMVFSEKLFFPFS